MSTPPQGEHEEHTGGPPADDRTGAWPSEDPNATRPAPTWEPRWPGGAGQAAPPPYGPQPPSGHQPSGAPAHGQPGGADPAGTSKAPLVAAVIGALLLLLAGAVALALSLQTTVLDRTAVERDVAAQFEEREGVALDLDCADEMEVDEGATYECTGTTDHGEELTLRIAITDETVAAYTWGAP